MNTLRKTTLSLMSALGTQDIDLVLANSVKYSSIWTALATICRTVGFEEWVVH
ncbi:MAG: hypothetical protein ACPGSM_17065 [Thiolinea sp.]